MLVFAALFLMCQYLEHDRNVVIVLIMFRIQLNVLMYATLKMTKEQLD